MYDNPVNIVRAYSPLPQPVNLYGSPCDISDIEQLDGNISISESDNLAVTSAPRIAPVGRATHAQYLPTIAAYNVRSFFPKINGVKTDLIEREISLSFFSEVWQKKESKTHLLKIEGMLQMHGLKYISTPRPSGWGGAAIIVNQDKYLLEKLNIIIPHNLEVVWGLVTCKSEDAKFKKIIVCSFYSPPQSRKNQKLTDHLVSTLHMLATKYPKAAIIMGADKNSMNLQPILKCGLKLKQIVDIGTRQGAILDVLITNIPQYYNSPVLIPPVPCDDPSAGVPSDHWVPVCYPHTDKHSAPLRRFRTVEYRPLPDENIRKYGQWITSTDFSGISSSLSVSEHAQKLQELLMDKLDELCPTQTMRVSQQDKPFINKELKMLNRRKQRTYVKEGKSQKYLDIKKEFDKKYKAAAERYIRAKVDDLKEAQPGRAYNILKTLGSEPGCTDDHTFSLPAHKEQNLSDEECANKIAEHFAEISAEFKPLDPTQLPDRVKVKVNDDSRPPVISEHDCYIKLRSAKKPKSVIPGDLPNTIVKEFMVELSNPVSELCNNIAQSARWPEQFKTEYITPIAKTQPPLTEDDLRPIAMTSFFSKIMEQFVVSWLLEIVGKKMDF